MFNIILVPLDGSKIGKAVLPVVEEPVSKLLPRHKVEITFSQVVLSTHWTVAAGVNVRFPILNRS